MAIISPYDKSARSTRSRRRSGTATSGVNPTSDGAIIRVVFPQLTEERRRDLIKVAKTKAEDGRIAIRNIRRHAKETLDKLAKDGEVGEDDVDPGGEGAREDDAPLRRGRRRRAASQGIRTARGVTRGHEVIDLSEPSEAPAPAGGHGRAGRNLPVAIAIGLVLGAVVLTSLYTVKPVFLAVVVLAVGYGDVGDGPGAGRQGLPRAATSRCCSAPPPSSARPTPSVVTR